MRLRYCIDNGAMIAQAGVYTYLYNGAIELKDTVCSQRYASCCCCDGVIDTERMSL